MLQCVIELKKKKDEKELIFIKIEFRDYLVLFIYANKKKTTYIYINNKKKKRQEKI